MAIGGAVADEIMFEVSIRATARKTVSESTEYDDLLGPYEYEVFTEFTASLQSVEQVIAFLMPETDVGEYLFTAHILDAEKGVIGEGAVGATFYLLTNPVTELNATTAFFSLNESPDATYLRMYYGDELILEQEFRSLLCNDNSVCENSYAGDEGIFENYRSCPSDCDYFSEDGNCNIAPGKDYSFDDHYCDPDCFHDMNEGDEYGGECFKPNCNDGVQNQGEMAVDCGGVCEPCPKVPAGEAPPQIGEEEPDSSTWVIIGVLVVMLLVFLYFRFVRAPKARA